MDHTNEPRDSCSHPSSGPGTSVHGRIPLAWTLLSREKEWIPQISPALTHEHIHSQVQGQVLDEEIVGAIVTITHVRQLETAIHAPPKQTSCGCYTLFCASKHSRVKSGPAASHRDVEQACMPNAGSAYQPHHRGPSAGGFTTRSIAGARSPALMQLAVLRLPPCVTLACDILEGCLEER
jgi:hypothetical protein